MLAQAEGALNEGMQPLKDSLQEAANALNYQLTKAQEMLTQLREQRDKLQEMLDSLGDPAVDPSMADMAVQLLLSGSEAQLQLGEFRIESGRTQLEAGKTQLEAAQKEYDSAREEALKSANLDQLLNMTTLTQLSSRFSAMPNEPFSKRSSSLDLHLSSPCTLAMPSPT